MLVLGLGVVFCAQASGGSLPPPWRGMQEAPPVPYAPPQPRAMALTREWIQLYLPERAYQVPAVEDPNHYRIHFPDGRQIVPTAVTRRHFPEFAPFNAAPNIIIGVEAIAKIQTVYRVFLRLPSDALLNENEQYLVSITPDVLSGGEQFSFTFNPAAANDTIHTNQVGYFTHAPKSARVSFWVGQGSIDFDAYPSFHIIDTDDGSQVFSGPLTLLKRASAEPYAKSDVYAADFSALTREGTYRLYAPGVGSSYPFRINRNIPYELGFTAVRALMHQRDGDHGLDRRARTLWRRPAAHLDDAIDEATGIRVELTGGHMDAGDRGKYAYSMGLMSAYLLSGARLYPEAIESLGDDLGLPESGNGIPDYLDELVWELDAIHKMIDNTSLGGAQGHVLRPLFNIYEQNSPMEGEPNRVFQSETMGRSRANTLLTAGALAMAYNTPMIRQYFPDRALRYLQAARKAFATYEAHADDDAFFNAECCHYYDQTTAGRVRWSDEALLAAINLLEATGDPNYLAHVQREMPADVTNVMIYGFHPNGPWLPTFLSLAQATHPSFDAALIAKGRQGILNMANELLTKQMAYGTLIDDRMTLAVGWYFTAQTTSMPMAIAHGISGNELYRQWGFTSWDYMLGTNPLSRSSISGLGMPERRPRWLVHEISRLQYRLYAQGKAGGWPEMIPGIPNADMQNGDFNWWFTDPWNDPRMDADTPGSTSYYPLLRHQHGLTPAMYRYHDAHVVWDEFSAVVLGAQALSVLPMIEAARTTH